MEIVNLVATGAALVELVDKLVGSLAELVEHINDNSIYSLLNLNK